MTKASQERPSGSLNRRGETLQVRGEGGEENLLPAYGQELRRGRSAVLAPNKGEKLDWNGRQPSASARLRPRPVDAPPKKRKISRSAQCRSGKYQVQ